MAVGTAALDFGSTADVQTSVAVTGQAAIVAESRVEAFVRIEATANHSADEARLENLKITAGNIVAGTGFTIYGECTKGTATGIYNVDWVYV